MTEATQALLPVTQYAHESEYSLEYFSDTKPCAPNPRHRCPTCDSPDPHRHPAMAFEGEVEICTDDYHLIPTGQNRYIAAVLAKREARNAA